MYIQSSQKKYVMCHSADSNIYKFLDLLAHPLPRNRHRRPPRMYLFETRSRPRARTARTLEVEWRSHPHHPRKRRARHACPRPSPVVGARLAQSAQFCRTPSRIPVTWLAVRLTFIFFCVDAVARRLSWRYLRLFSVLPIPVPLLSYQSDDLPLSFSLSVASLWSASVLLSLSLSLAREDTRLNL